MLFGGSFKTIFFFAAVEAQDQRAVGSKNAVQFLDDELFRDARRRQTFIVIARRFARAFTDRSSRSQIHRHIVAADRKPAGNRRDFADAALRNAQCVFFIEELHRPVGKKLECNVFSTIVLGFAGVIAEAARAAAALPFSDQIIRRAPAFDGRRHAA